MTLLLYQEFFRLEFPSGAIGDTIADSICGVSTVCQSILEGGAEVFAAKVFEKMRISCWNWKYLHWNRNSFNDSIRGKRARWKFLSLKRNPRMLKVSFSITLKTVFFFLFIGPESDHWLCLSVTHWLTDSLTDSVTFSKPDWCDPGV